MYQYGYHVADKKVILGTVDQSGFGGMQKEINWANRIDSSSRWFIEAAEHSVQADGGEVLPPHKHTYIDGYCACGVSITRRR